MGQNGEMSKAAGVPLQGSKQTWGIELLEGQAACENENGNRRERGAATTAVARPPASTGRQE